MMGVSDPFIGRETASAQANVPPVRRDIERMRDWMQDAYEAAVRTHRSDPGDGVEWIADNAFALFRALGTVEQDLSVSRIRRLPVAEDGRETRTWNVARYLVTETDGRLDYDRIVALLRDGQDEHDLCLSELWALPAMIRLVGLDLVARGAAEAKTLPPPPFDTHGRQPDPATAISRGCLAIITVDKLNWVEVVDATSAIHAVLREDPAGVFEQMDEDSRSLYASEVERLARGSRLTERQVARRAVEAASQHEDEPRSGHVGAWLIGEDLRLLERRCGYRPRLRERISGAASRARAPLYGWAIATAFVLFLLPPILYLLSFDAGAGALAGGAVLSILPAAVLAMTLVNWLTSRLVRPMRLPALDFDDGIPDASRTAVAVPIILRDAGDVPAIMTALEVRYAANADPNLRYVCLSDPGDAQAARTSHDDALEEALIRGIDALNDRHPGRPFALLHRGRSFNEREGHWMAWERKRGKIEQFNRFLVHGDVVPFPVRAGDVDALRDVRFVITLDADTVMPPGAAARLVGTHAHPLNAPSFEPTIGRVVEGYGVLQPRIEILPSGGPTTWFARLLGGEGSIDGYARVVSDVYQDVFGSGLYCGKGIYEPRAFMRSLDGRVPENAVLSHDLLEGLFARAGFASHVVLYEDYPETYPQYAARLHRWTRGDWQLLPLALAHRHMSKLDQWKLLDNLRRSLTPPALLVLFVAGWIVLPGSALVWTLLALLAPTIHMVSAIRSATHTGVRGRIGAALRTLSLPAGRWFLLVTFLVADTLVVADGALRALWRTVVSRQSMLQWRTAAHVPIDASRSAVWRTMWPSTAFAAALGLNIALFDVVVLWTAAPVLLLWLLAPEIAFRLGLPRSTPAEWPTLEDRHYLLRVARRTWHYFETHVGPGTNWLPPDNHQHAPVERTAERTSPTNIGLYLVSASVARDLGFATTPDLMARCENALDAMSRAERHNGHLLNWYDTRMLVPLEPRYVSSVDSGNLAVSLLTVAGALERENDDIRTGIGGLLVTASVLEGALTDEASRAALRAVTDRLEAAREQSRRMPHFLGHAMGPAFDALSDALVTSEDTSVEALHWADRLRRDGAALRRLVSGGGSVTREKRSMLAKRLRSEAFAMDFRFLYDAHRHLLRIGYNVSTAHFDENHYDLLASEARLASYFAIAKGDVPSRHWFAMARPTDRILGWPILRSWSGSMFEYLMAPLFLPEERDTLLGDSALGAIAMQRRVAEDRPWGVSESGFALVDADGNWQYRAFGASELGLRRAATKDAVAAPYASALALPLVPHAAVANLREMEEQGALGRYGFIEALDFTTARVPAGKAFASVDAAMAHHQGMTLAAIANALVPRALWRDLAREPRIAACEPLLHEAFAEQFETTPDVAELVGEAETSPRGLPGWPSERPAYLGNATLTVRIAPDGAGETAMGGAVLARHGRAGAAGPFAVIERDARSTWALGTRGPTVHHRPHVVETAERDDGLAVHTDVVVVPDRPVEMRRLTFVNETSAALSFRVRLASEVVLDGAEALERHPAFSRMFVHGRREGDALLFRRNSRSPKEKRPALAVRLELPGAARIIATHCARDHVVGRAGSPTPEALGVDEGWVLDPVAAFEIALKIAPYAEVECVLALASGDTEDDALEHVRAALRMPFDWVLRQAEREAVREADLLAVHGDDWREAEILADHISSASALGACGQPELWSIGLSGDLPIVPVEIENGTPAFAQLVRLQRLLERRGCRFDLAALLPGEGYDEPARRFVLDALRESEVHGWLGRDGGVHLVSERPGEPSPARRAARLVVGAEDATVEKAIERLRPVPHETALFEPLVHRTTDRGEKAEKDNLAFANAWGGLAANGDYLVSIEDDPTPAPWCNVLANERFGSIVSEAGLGFTWARNSGEFKLTPWSNDPIADPQSEALWLRDEETGEAWTVTPLPSGGRCTVSHGLARTQWRRRSNGLEQTQTAFVPPTRDAKIVSIHLRNESEQQRRLTATFLASWQLGATASRARPYIRSSFDARAQAIVAVNPWTEDFAHLHAYAAAVDRLHDYGTRDEEHAQGGIPDSVTHWDLAQGEAGAPCAALQCHCDLDPGEERTLTFALGCEETVEGIASAVDELRETGAIERLQRETADWWEGRLGAVEVETRDSAFDAMVNRWLPYQNLASRLLARAGFYQAGGAYGFRDQLQDVLAVLVSEPERARKQILRAASRQFEAGDVLHWWHPPHARGVRTRITDDLLWLPFVSARYVEATGDTAILDETVPWLAGEELAGDEHDRYAVFATEGEASLFDHCAAAIERGRRGPNGLPLIGTGDWNDGMDRVGDEGRGTSVWLGWFTVAVLDAFAPLAETRGHPDLTSAWRTRAHEIRHACEKAWDGAWYRRAFDDEGRILGSRGASECEIDSISQSWAVFAGGMRARQAMESVGERLVDRDARLVKLLAPPFAGETDPGYIAAYPPGIRENGGQYTHAAAWVGLARAEGGDVDGALEIFDLLSPLRRSDLATYKREPYVLSADVAAGDHEGRGGWSWYTGAAGWMWQLAVNGILGLQLKNGEVSFEPRLPSGWPSASITVRRGGTATRYTISRDKGGAARVMEDEPPELRAAS